MKIKEIPPEFKDRVEFACKVCRSEFKSETGRDTKCAWRGCGGEVCLWVERVIEEYISKESK